MTKQTAPAAVQTVSVALCTYNGARYIGEQLASIGAQDRLPDELVLVDDGSSDDTLNVVRTFAETAPFPVRIHPNPQNIGSTRSFEKAVTLCTGDVIVLSDQDDAWRADRLSKTIAYLNAHPDKLAVFSDADIINDDSNPTGRRIWEVVQFTPAARQRWQQGEAHQLLFDGYVVTGATLAIRRAVLPLVVPFPTHVAYLIHDAWISLVLALHNAIGFIDEPLIRYRMHGQQQVGFKAPRPKVTLRDRLSRGRAGKLMHVVKLAEKYQQTYELLRKRPDIDPQRLTKLRRMTEHLTRRTTLPAARLARLAPVLREVVRGNYQLFPGRWWLTVLGDLLED